jgi:Phosphopantetheine attachment site
MAATSTSPGSGPRLRTAYSSTTLDRDLGIGSLERVELVLRLEQAFGVRLGDAVMAEAERSQDHHPHRTGCTAGARPHRSEFIDSYGARRSPSRPSQ